MVTRLRDVKKKNSAERAKQPATSGHISDNNEANKPQVNT